MQGRHPYLAAAAAAAAVLHLVSAGTGDKVRIY